jgi:integrase/recombinase XerC
VENVQSEPYRDTRGPGREGFARMLRELLRRDQDAKTLRDTAAVRLLFDLALRREEVVSLDVADLDLDRGTLQVLGKGRSQREALSLPDPTRQALARWLSARGSEPGPLFVNFDRARKGEERRLTGRSLHRIVVDLGRRAGLRHVSPHGIRHAAITEALDLTGGDVRAVQRFSRHRDLRVLNIYDDSREDLAGQVATLVAGGRPARGRWRRRSSGPLHDRATRDAQQGGVGPSRVH